MNIISPVQGFHEIEHTSDIALEVWGGSLESLFLETAKGLHTLMGIKTQRRSKAFFHKEINGMDKESLLISFLDDLLFHVEQENCWCHVEHLSLSKMSIAYTGNMLQIQKIQKQVKAATFHGLEIVYKRNCWKTHIVFDV
jgi:SHS2 domain-containing protein